MCRNHIFPYRLRRYTMTYKNRPNREELHNLYVDYGMTTAAIGDTCGVAGRTVGRWLAIEGIPTRHGSEMHLFGKHKPTKDELNKLYTIDNLSTIEIGKMVCVHYHTIRKWLKFYDIPIRSVSEAHKGKWVGEKSPSWRGGKNKYCYKFTEEFKESIREEFGRKCFICGKSESDNDRKLSVHHTNYDRGCMCGNIECRFVPLCTSCHTRTNYNRFYWYSRILCKLLLESSSDYVNMELNV